MKVPLYGRNYQRIGLVVLMGLTTFFLYLPVRDFDFVHFDDYGYVTENLFVNEGLIPANIIDAFSIYLMANWHPVTWLSYMLDCEFFGVSPGALHIVNALIHAVNSILLCLVLKRMTGAFWKSLFVAALFAWHPVHVESVAWISERKDVLYAFFWFLSMGAYIAYAKRNTIGLYLLTIFLCVMSLMSKPMAVTLPFVLLLMDWWPLGRFHHAEPQRIRLIVMEKLPIFLFSGFTCFQTFLAQQHGTAIKTLDDLGMTARITNAVTAYASYLWMMIRPTHLAVIYPHSYSVYYGKTFICGFILLVITVTVVLSWKNRPYLGFGWLWYLGTLVPVIGILQVGTQALADRYTYVPLIGIFIMIAWSLHNLIKQHPRLKPAVIATCCTGLCTCLFLSHLQIAHWKDTYTLFSHTLKVTKNNAKAHFSMSCILFDQENWSEAEFHLREALKYRPDGAQYRVRLGHALTELNKYDQALAEFKQVQETKPDFELTYYYLGELYLQQNDPEQALVHYRKSLILNPYSFRSMDRVAWILSTSQNPEVRDGQVAVHLCEKLLSFFTKPPARFICTMAAAYAEAGRFEKAVSTATKALQVAQKEKQPNNKLKETITNGLEVYKQGQPYRDISASIEAVP